MITLKAPLLHPHSFTPLLGVVSQVLSQQQHNVVNIFYVITNNLAGPAPLRGAAKAAPLRFAARPNRPRPDSEVGDICAFAIQGGGPGRHVEPWAVFLTSESKRGQCTLAKHRDRPTDDLLKSVTCLCSHSEQRKRRLKARQELGHAAVLES
jgi:hypothetical protein